MYHTNQTGGKRRKYARKSRCADVHKLSIMRETIDLLKRRGAGFNVVCTIFDDCFVASNFQFVILHLARIATNKNFAQSEMHRQIFLY